MIIEFFNEDWSISHVLGSSLILMRMMLFQLSGHGKAKNDANPIFLLILKAFYQGFQMVYNFFQNFFGNWVKKTKYLTKTVGVQKHNFLST